MNEHKIQLGYDNVSRKHYACVIDETSGREIYKTNLCKTVNEALQQVQKNVRTPHLKQNTPFTTEKDFPVIKKELDQRFCSS